MERPSGKEREVVRSDLSNPHYSENLNQPKFVHVKIDQINSKLVIDVRFALLVSLIESMLHQLKIIKN